MPVKIKIPAREIMQSNPPILVLSGVDRCSRCDQVPARFFEVHRLKYRAGILARRLVSNKFKTTRNILLKIPVCEACFQSDFLTNPEALDRNGSPLAKIAHFHSVTRSLGGLLAALGFLLLTPFVPNSGLLQPLKHIWQIPVVVGVLVLLLSWLSQRKYQSKVLHEIETKNPGFRPRPRADVYAPILANEQDTSLTALVITMENTSWAEEVAALHGWTLEKPQEQNPAE